MCFGETNGWRGAGCVVDLILLPIVCIAGLFLNSLCLLVFFCRKSDHPIVPALIFLSICDLLQLLLSLFVLVLPAAHDFLDASDYSILGQIAFLSTGLLSPLLLASNCASIWAITYISIRRYKAIRYPLKQITSNGESATSLGLIALAALSFNFPRWLEFDWKWIETPEGSSRLVHSSSQLNSNRQYRLIMDNILYPLCVYILPLVALCSLSCGVLSVLANRQARQGNERRCASLLMAIVFVFFVCHTGGLLFRILAAESDISDSTVFLKDFVNLLFNINSLANPFLYFFFTRHFRDLRHGLPSPFISRCVSYPTDFIPSRRTSFSKKSVVTSPSTPVPSDRRKPSDSIHLMVKQNVHRCSSNNT